MPHFESDIVLKDTLPTARLLEQTALGYAYGK